MLADRRITSVMSSEDTVTFLYNKTRNKQKYHVSIMFSMCFFVRSQNKQTHCVLFLCGGLRHPNGELVPPTQCPKIHITVAENCIYLLIFLKCALDLNTNFTNEPTHKASPESLRSKEEKVRSKDFFGSIIFKNCLLL